MVTPPVPLGSWYQSPLIDESLSDDSKLLVQNVARLQCCRGKARGVAAFQPLPCERFKLGVGAVETLRLSRGKDLRRFSASVSLAQRAFQDVRGVK